MQFRIKYLIKVTKCVHILKFIFILDRFISVVTFSFNKYNAIINRICLKQKGQSPRKWVSFDMLQMKLGFM